MPAPSAVFSPFATTRSSSSSSRRRGTSDSTASRPGRPKMSAMKSSRIAALSAPFRGAHYGIAGAVAGSTRMLAPLPASET